MRGDDEAGLGLAYLDGADEIDETYAIEAYARFQISAHSDVSVDVQYVEDDFAASGADDPEAFVVGVRFNSYF